MLELSHHSPELPFLTKLIEQTLQGLKTNQVEIIHGSLLTYRELLLNAGMVGHFPGSMSLCVPFGYNLTHP